MEKISEDNPGKYERILLITHEELRKFYERAGFEWIGQSDVVHGVRPWFEMRKDIAPVRGTTQTLSGPQEIPAGVLEALQRSRTDIPQSRLLSDFHHGLSDLLSEDRSLPGAPSNKFDLLCPRADCGSIILKKGVGHWVERASIQVSPL